MSGLLSAWLVLNLLVLVGWALCAMMRWLPLPSSGAITPPLQIWSPSSAQSEPISVQVLSRSMPMDRRTPARLSVGLAIAAVPGLLLLVMGLLSLRLRLRGTHLWRRLGPVELRSGERAWTLWIPGRAVVVLDPARPLQPALAHELQHLRSRDPHWAWLSLALRLACPLNPAAWAWARLLTEVDEYACDAALVPRFSARTYALGLVQAATPSSPQGGLLTLSMAPPTTLLKRRIHMLTTPTPARPWLHLPLIALGLALLGGTALASGGVLLDHRVSQAELVELTAASAMNIQPHPLIQQRLERMVATTQGRAFYGPGLARLDAQGHIASQALERHGVPQELIAVAFVESGFESLPQGGPMDSAGAWQFIPATARAYGLRVDGHQDQRLDLVLSSEAAASLLSDLHTQFDDWGLALAAYNQGAAKVQQAIQEQGSRDVYVLMETGALNNYVATVYAGVLVLESPELLLE